MVSALAFTVLVEHPDSAVAAAIANPWLRRLVIGLGMGASAIVLIYSGWGMRSGAHMNPAVTLSFARLGLIPRSSVAGYIAAQFIGGVVGTGAGWLLFGSLVEHPSVRFAVTQPGPWGPGAAFAAEVVMTALQMGAVLAVARVPAWRPHAGLVAASLLVLFITVEAPVSGMSLNPARTLGSAVWADQFTALWVYFSAPVLGMLLAAGIMGSTRPRGKDTP